MIWMALSWFVLGAIWRRYYGYWTHLVSIPRLGGKYGAIATLSALFGASVWYVTGDLLMTLVALPASLMWAGGFGDWARWSLMFNRYTVWTALISVGLLAYTLEPLWALYAPVGMIGLVYPALNRVQQYVPLIGYTEWCEFITGGVVLGGLMLGMVCL